MFQYGVTKELTPGSFGICLRGNGIEDQLHFDVDPEDTKINLLHKFNDVKSIFVIEKYNFAAISRKEEPSTLIIITNGECAKFIYDEQNPKRKLLELPIYHIQCVELIREVRLPVKQVSSIVRKGGP